MWKSAKNRADEADFMISGRSPFVITQVSEIEAGP